jgi:hypothetical protein
VAATAPEVPERARHLVGYGAALADRFRTEGDQESRAKAVGAFRESAELPTAPVRVRIDGAVKWAQLSAEGGDWRDAAEGAAVAVGLLPLVGWRGLPRQAQEEYLAPYSGLASLAADCALSAGLPERAVEFLEQGRSVLWSQLLQTRSDLSILADAAPALAEELNELRAELDGRSGQPLVLAAEPGAPAEREQLQAADRKMKAARKWDERLAEVRRLPGFSSFLLPPAFDQLKAAADNGHVVLVNIGPYRSDALLVDSTGVEVLPLPGLTRENADERVRDWLGALERLENPFASADELAGARRRTVDTMAWLWERVAEPVLIRLGATGTPGDDAEWPQVWWCPTGPLTVLPLHAAGRSASDGHGQAVIERVVSFYTPTLAALSSGEQAGKPLTPACSSWPCRTPQH